MLNFVWEMLRCSPLFAFHEYIIAENDIKMLEQKFVCVGECCLILVWPRFLFMQERLQKKKKKGKVSFKSNF